MTRLADVLDESFRLLKKNAPTEEIVCQTVELLELKTTSQVRHLEALKNSLKAAEDQVNSVFKIQTSSRKICKNVFFY